MEYLVVLRKCAAKLIVCTLFQQTLSMLSMMIAYVGSGWR